MNKKIVIIVVLTTLVIGSISAGAVNIDKIVSTNNEDPVPTIYYVYDYSSGEEIDFGYTLRLVKFRTRNEIGGSVDIEFDFGDGTTDTKEGIRDWLDMNHEFTRSGTFDVKARYKGHSSWSDDFTFEVKDHCDLEFVSLKTDPSKFGKRDKVDIIATFKNAGTISTPEGTKMYIYEGYDNFDDKNPIEEKSIGTISEGKEVTITLKDFRWYGDEYSHSFVASIDEVSGEIDWSELGYSDYTNNYGSQPFNAPKTKTCPMLTNLLENFPLVK